MIESPFRVLDCQRATVVDDLAYRNHQVGTEAILPFAEGAGGKIVHVRDVPNGKRCGCICPECRKPLVANQGRKKEWHFAHYSGRTCNPKKALETTLHRLAKQIIQERGVIKLPAVIAVVGGNAQPIHEGGLFRPNEVAQEVTMPGMRPDLVARQGDKTLFIEIAVWHKVGRPKQALIEERRHATIEIDLKEFRHQTDVAVLEQLILYEAPREWLFNSAKHDREERARKAAEAVAAARRAREEAVAQIVLKDLETPTIAAPAPGSSWARHIKLVVDTGFGDAVGVPIDGDGAFSVASRIWQAMVLAKVIWSGARYLSLADFELERSPGGLVRPAVSAARLNEDTNWDLIQKMTDGRVRPPQLVLRDYLDLMARRGILAWRGPEVIGSSWATTERVRTMVQRADDRRKRLDVLRQVFADTVEAISVEDVSFEKWLDTAHHGLSVTPREVAMQGGDEFATLERSLREIALLSQPGTKPYDGPSFGLPIDQLIAERKAEAEERIAADERQRQEEAQRREAEREEQERKMREAAGPRLEQMMAVIRTLGELGERLRHVQLAGLGNRTIEETEGVMTPQEEAAAWGAIRYMQRSAAPVDATRRKAGDAGARPPLGPSFGAPRRRRL